MLQPRSHDYYYAESHIMLNNIAIQHWKLDRKFITCIIWFTLLIEPGSFVIKSNTYGSVHVVKLEHFSVIIEVHLLDSKISTHNTQRKEKRKGNK